MAISATFTADFSRWDKALADAKTAVKSLEVPTRGLQSQLTRLSTSLSGANTIREAKLVVAGIDKIGGATRLTDSELRKANSTLNEAIAKYKALGQQVLADLKKVADQVGHVVETNKRLGESAGASALSFTKLAGSYLTAQAVLGVVQTGFSKLTEFVGDSIKSYSEAEAATKKLSVALQNQGTALPGVVDKLTDLSSAYQDTTAYSDDAVSSAQALLVQIGDVMPNEMDKALRATTDLAAGLGIDLEQAATLVSKAVAGNTGALSRYGISIDDAAVKAEGANAVFKALEQRFGGQAQAQLETYAGKVQQLANRWDDFKESIGKALVNSPLAESALRGLTDATKQLGDEAAKAGPRLSGLLKPIFGEISAGTVSILEDVADATNSVADATARLASFKRPDLFANADFTELPGILARGRAEVERLTEAQEKAKKAAEAHAKEIKNLRDQLSGSGLRADLSKLAEAWRGLTDEQRGSEFTIHQTSDAYMKFIPALKEVPPELQKTVAQMNGVAIAAGAMNETIGVYGVKSFDGLGEALTGVDSKLGLLIADMAIFEGSAKRGLSSLNGIGIDIGKPEAFKPPANFLSEFANGLPDVILGAFQGGGSVGKSIGGALGGSLTKGLFGDVTKGLGKTVTAGLSKVLGSTIGGALGSVLPGIGTLLGSGLGSLVGKLFGPSKGAVEGKKADEQIAGLQQQLLQTYGSLERIHEIGQAVGVDLSLAWGDKNVQGLQHFTESMAEFQGRLDAITGATQKYGLTLDELGPRFQQFQVDSDISGLIEDWKALQGAGADMDAVLKKMAPSWVDVIEKALKFGTEVDPSMQQIVQRLQDLGLLVDDTGAKIDASGLKFKDFGQAGIDAASGVADALDRIPDRINPHIDFDVSGLPRDFPGGPGGRNFSQGGVVYAATGKLIAFTPRGTDTVPAMLTPGERVLSRSQNAKLTNWLEGGAPGGGDVTIVTPVYIDGELVARKVVKRTGAELRRKGVA